MLEREVQDLRRSLDRMTVRNPSTAPVKNSRLARTVNGGTSYPSSGNTFYIEFLDGSYTKSPGNQTPTLAARQSVNFAVCQNLASTLPSEGTKLHVFEWRGYWWTYWAEGDTTPPATFDFPAQIFSGCRYWEAKPTGDNVATEVTGSDAGKFIQGAAYGSHGSLDFQYLSFTYQYGQDLGIDFVTNAFRGELFDFQEDGIYQVYVECQNAVMFRKPGASAPSPGIGVHASIYIQEQTGGVGCWDGLNNGDAALEVASAIVMSDSPTAGTMTHPDGTATTYYSLAMTGTTTVYIEPSTNTDRQFFMGAKIATPSSVYDGWGFVLGDINVVIKRLDTTLTEINV